MTEKQIEDLNEGLKSLASLCEVYTKYKCVELAIEQLRAGGTSPPIDLVIQSAKKIHEFITEEG